MPTYTYKCNKCGYRFDQFQHFADDPLELCPKCEELALRKVYQPVGIVFKGKGFYATDNRSPSGMASQKSDSGESHTPSEPAKSSSAESSSPTTEKTVVKEAAKENTATPAATH